MADLQTLAQKLLQEGPHKTEATPRRVRGLFGGKYIFDTTKVVYVWEHKYYPYFYVPESEFAKGTLERLDGGNGEKQKGFWVGRLSAGGKRTERVIGFEGEGPLKDLVRVEFTSIDSWFAEDTPLLGTHPKDPYKRIECLPSSREIRIEVNGHVIARSTQNVFLYETMLRTRYYLSPTGIEWGYLGESGTESFCPYKGRANYYNVTVDGKEVKDAVWYYEYPTAESALIAGRLCFYNEKVDIFVDGVKEEK